MAAVKVLLSGSIFESMEFFMFLLSVPCSVCAGKLINNVRAVERSENPGVPVLFGGHNLPPLVDIGLTDLPKSGCAMAHRRPDPPKL